MGPLFKNLTNSIPICCSFHNTQDNKENVFWCNICFLPGLRLNVLLSRVWQQCHKCSIAQKVKFVIWSSVLILHWCKRNQTKLLLNPCECPQLIFLSFSPLFFLVFPLAPSTHETFLQWRRWMTALFPVALCILCCDCVVLVQDSMISQLLCPPVVDK